MHCALNFLLRQPRPGFMGLFGFVMGTALQLQQEALWWWVAYGCIVLLALVVYAQVATFFIASGVRPILLFIALGLLGYGLTGLRSTAYMQSALEPVLEGRELEVVGVVAQMPQHNAAGLRFRLKVESARLDGQLVDVPPRLDVGWYDSAFTSASVLGGPQPARPALRAGERWQMTLRLKAPHGSLNPHGFDYELWLWEQGVQATGYVRDGGKNLPPQLLGQTWRYPVALARQSVRSRIESRVADRQLAGMIAALVVGDQGAIERVDWDVFRATGVAHLVSISGLHITMFAWGAALLVGWLWRRSARLCLLLPAPSAAMLGGVALACMYAAFAGWGVPAQRTCIMLATVALLRLSGARWPWPHVWMLACAVVLSCDPWALMQPGFWLSFVAVGVLFATDLGAGYASPIGLRGRFTSFFREQWVMTVALAPLTLLLFGQMSVVGLAANALAIPWITLLVTPLAMLGVLAPPLWDMAAAAIGLLMLALHWLASLPWATLSIATPPLWVGAAGALGAAIAVFPWAWHMRVLGLPLILPLVFWQNPLIEPGQFELLMADVGQGNAILVRTARHALLYDAGPRYSLDSDAGHRTLVPLLQALHIRLDRLVLSHRDTDHVGGAAAVLGMQPDADLLSSIEPGHPLQALRKARRCLAGEVWSWDGVQFEVLHPQLDDYEAGLRPNAMSCVLRISNGVQAALLPGDLEKSQEERLVAQGVVMQAQVIVVPHHGSKTSSSPGFLKAVQPKFALVQAGYRNRFGHPVAAVVERYREKDGVVMDSPHCGAMVWQSWQPQNVACQRVNERRYWHHRVP
jgi:competence protein ComEC